MHLFRIRHFIPALFVCTFSVTTAFVAAPEAQAQDLIARQAPVDRKMKAVDSVAINKVLHKRQNDFNYESNSLYSSWDTERVHCYSESDVPDTYRIDLRGFSMPTPSRVVTSNYGYRASFGRMHKGLDIKVYIGDTISSAFDGKVRVVAYEGKGYGNYVVVRHGNGLETVYGHLSKHLCKVGDIVKAGQPIGLGGNTGRSTGSHLHFETRVMGQAIDPSELFDFVHQDVTCDFYDFYKKGISHAVAARETVENNDLALQPEEPVVVEEPVVAQVETKSSKKEKKSKKDKADQGKVYKVRQGDTLYSISRRFGVTVGQLCSKNKLNERTTLRLGQILRY